MTTKQFKKLEEILKMPHHDDVNSIIASKMKIGSDKNLKEMNKKGSIGSNEIICDVNYNNNMQ